MLSYHKRRGAVSGALGVLGDSGVLQFSVVRRGPSEK